MKNSTKAAEREPHGKYVKYSKDGPQFWEPRNPNCWLGEDCPMCNPEQQNWE